jgi:hypothetical protein
LRLAVGMRPSPEADPSFVGHPSRPDSGALAADADGQVEWPGEFRPPALADPGVSLSAHRALVIRPWAAPSPASGRRGLVRVVGQAHAAPLAARGRGTTGSHVPHRSPDQARATSTPDTTWPISRHPPDSSRTRTPRPVSMPPICFRHVLSGSLTLAFMAHTWARRTPSTTSSSAIGRLQERLRTSRSDSSQPRAPPVSTSYSSASCFAASVSIRRRGAARAPWTSSSSIHARRRKHC